MDSGDGSPPLRAHEDCLQDVMVYVVCSAPLFDIVSWPASAISSRDRSKKCVCGWFVEASNKISACHGNLRNMS